MKFLLWIVIACAALVVLLLVVGVVFVPADHVATRKRALPAPREAVWKVIRDVEYAANWRSDVQRVELVADAGGKPGFREFGGHRSVLFEIDVDEPPARLVTRIADPDSPFAGTWTLELAERDGGSELTITERGTIRNPLLRTIASVAFSPTKTMERYLDDLEKALARH